MLAITEKKILDTVGLIYEAASDTSGEGLDRAYTRVSELVSSGPGSIHLVDRATRSHKCVTCTHGNGFFDDFNSGYYELIPYRERLEKLRVGELFDRKADCPDDIFLDSALYREYYKRLGFYQILYQKLHVNPKFSIGIAFSRPESMPDFSAREFRALSALTPHLERGIEFWLDRRRKSTEFQALDHAMADADEAVILAGCDGKVEFINPAGERMIAESGQITVDASCHVGIADAKDNTELRRLILSVFDIPSGSVQGGSMQLSSSDGGSSYLIGVAPFVAASSIPGTGPRKALITVKRSLAREMTNSSAIYGLTPAESRVAALLCDGLSLREAAEKLGVSGNTTRTHLKRIFSKTDTHRQGSLIRLLMTHRPRPAEAVPSENNKPKIPHLGDDLSVIKTDTCN